MGEPGGNGGSQSGPVVEVEFSIHGPSYPFTEVSKEHECRFELAKMVPRPGERYAEFFNVIGIDTGIIERLGADYKSVEITLLKEYEDGGLFEFLVSGQCPAFRLAELGALPHIVESVHGRGRIVAEIPQRYDPAVVVESFLDEYEDVEHLVEPSHTR
jgi:hypothetical protein